MEKQITQELQERFKYGDLILSIMDKSVVEKEQEGSLVLNFTPECYVAGFQAISVDDSVLPASVQRG